MKRQFSWKNTPVFIAFTLASDSPSSLTIDVLDITVTEIRFNPKSTTLRLYSNQLVAEIASLIVFIDQGEGLG